MKHFTTRVDTAGAHEVVTVWLDRRNIGRLTVGEGEGALVVERLTGRELWRLPGDRACRLGRLAVAAFRHAVVGDDLSELPEAGWPVTAVQAVGASADETVRWRVTRINRRGVDDLPMDDVSMALRGLLDAVEQLEPDDVVDELVDQLEAEFDAARCRVCGCTAWHGCAEGCSWVEADLCSCCADPRGP